MNIFNVISLLAQQVSYCVSSTEKRPVITWTMVTGEEKRGFLPDTYPVHWTDRGTDHRGRTGPTVPRQTSPESEVSPLLVSHLLSYGKPPSYFSCEKIHAFRNTHLLHFSMTYTWLFQLINQIEVPSKVMKRNDH